MESAYVDTFFTFPTSLVFYCFVANLIMNSNVFGNYTTNLITKQTKIPQNDHKRKKCLYNEVEY